MENQLQNVQQQPPIENVDRLELMYQQVKDLEVGLLLSGLTILVKGTATYLTTHGIDNEMAEQFRLAHLAMLNNNRYYQEKFYPDLYKPLKTTKLPYGSEEIVPKAGQCKADLRLLTDCALEDEEWLRAPGWHFFQTYSGQRKSNILRGITLEKLEEAFCEGEDPYETKSEDSCKKEVEDNNPYKPVEAVIKRLVESDQQWNKFWYPVMLYLVVLIQKTNFETLEDTTR